MDEEKVQQEKLARQQAHEAFLASQRQKFLEEFGESLGVALFSYQYPETVENEVSPEELKTNFADTLASALRGTPEQQLGASRLIIYLFEQTQTTINKLGKRVDGIGYMFAPF